MTLMEKFVLGILKKEEYCFIKTDDFRLERVNKFARSNGLGFSIVRLMDRKGKECDYYKFWTDSQVKFREKYLTRMTWNKWGNWIVIGLFFYIISLFLLTLLQP